MKVAINGFGRIGRTILRQLLSSHPDVTIALINDIAPLDTCAYLFAYDSVFGPYPAPVSGQGGALTIGTVVIPVTQAPDISICDLSDVDVLIECTGHAKDRVIADRGLRAGAGAVLISGPSASADVTVVLGANTETLGDARVVSNGSCTTNALAPLLRVLDDAYGIAAAHMTTIHCYTSSQPMTDTPRGDLARSRAGALSMVPTTTSATTLVTQVLPQLQGRVTGAAVRVPTASVSAIDLVVTFDRDVTADALNTHLAQALSGIIGATDQPLVSVDLRGRPESLILATPETLQVTPNQLRLFGWYDNEWGFSARMIEMARLMAAR